jgi:hypothetical protein
MGLNPPPTYVLPDDSTGIQLATAVDEQRKIGWLNMFNGWISRRWGAAMQPLYSTRYSDKKHLNATTFQIRLIRGIWRFFDGVWTQRRCLIHETEDASKTRDLNKQITQLYRRRNHLVSRDDRLLFNMFRLNDCLLLSNSNKKTWISHVHLAIKLHHGSLKPLTAPLNTVTNYFDRQRRRDATAQSTPCCNTQEG